MIDEIQRVRFGATGLSETITPNLLSGIEERNEPIPYSTLCLVSDAFDCDPIDLVRQNQQDEEEDDEERRHG